MANTTPKVTDIDENGNVTVRNMTAEELAQKQADQAFVAQLAESLAAKESAKQAALTKLGLTAEELAAVLS